MSISRIVRLSLGLSLIVVASLSLTSTAYAKKEKAAAGATTYPVIEMTNIKEFDGVFGEAKTIHETIDAQTAAIKTAHDNVNTVLGVTAGAPLSDAMKGAVAAAGGKLKVDMAGAVPHLKVDDGAEASVQKNADAINGLVDVGVKTVETVTQLIPQAAKLVEACKDFPAQVPNLVTDPMALIKATKVVTNDMKAVISTPERIKALGDAAAAIFNDIKAAFAG